MTLSTSVKFDIANASVLSAELALRQSEQQPGFSVALLQIVASESYGPTIRLASALCFKNFVKRSWTVGISVSQLQEDEALTSMA